MKEIKTINELCNLDKVSVTLQNAGRKTYKFIDESWIENIPGPEWNASTNNMSLAEIIDLNSIAPLLENLSNLAQVSFELMDIKGETLIAPLKENICIEFHRNHPVSFADCHRNLEKIEHTGFEHGYQEFTCQNGLTEIVLPLHIHGKLLGTFFIGPFFKKKNENLIPGFKLQINKSGFDEIAYNKAIATIAVLSEERTSYIINIFSGFICLIKSIVQRNLAIANEFEERTKQRIEIQAVKQKAEESDKLKTAFLANMSHEIRTPMNSIIGFSELLTREGVSDEDRHTFTKIIKESGLNLLELIDDIIDLARIEANQVAICKTDFDINELMSELHSIFIEQSIILSKSHIELIVDPSNSESFALYSDRLRIKQILSNLIRNAYKFSEQGTIRFGCRKQAEEVIFYVKDSGIGISKEQQEFIFDRFRQGENNLSRKFGGAGLGLSIAKDLCNLLGGRIWFESEINSGSMFCFSLKYEIREFIQNSTNT